MTTTTTTTTTFLCVCVRARTQMTGSAWAFFLMGHFGASDQFTIHAIICNEILARESIRWKVHACARPSPFTVSPVLRYCTVRRDATNVFFPCAVCIHYGIHKLMPSHTDYEQHRTEFHLRTFATLIATHHHASRPSRPSGRRRRIKSPRHSDAHGQIPRARTHARTRTTCRFAEPASACASSSSSSSETRIRAAAMKAHAC